MYIKTWKFKPGRANLILQTLMTLVLLPSSNKHVCSVDVNPRVFTLDIKLTNIHGPVVRKLINANPLLKVT